MLLGVMATINQEIDFDTASIVAEEFGVTVSEAAPEEDPTEIVEVEIRRKAYSHVRRLLLLWVTLTMVKLPYWT